MSDQDRPLPGAIVTAPKCGCCHKPLDRGDDCYVCRWCRLAYNQIDPEDAPAVFLDKDAKPCGQPCGKSVHGGLTRCQLPKWHTSQHFNASSPVAVFRDREAARGIE